MVPLLVAALLIFAPCLISSQSSKQEWLPEEFHNPQYEPKKCGLNTNEPAHICDPNGLTGEHIGSINWILKDAAYNSTACSCSNYYCENHAKPLGYHIGVALVKRMKIQTNIDGKLNTRDNQGQIFAHNLKNTWNMGQCENDIIIFYSYDDKVLAMYGGRTAMSRLTPYYRNLLSFRVGSRFSEGRIVEALNNLLYDLKFVLNCDNQSHDCGLLEMRSGVPSIGVSTSVAVLVIVSTMFNLWKV